MALEAELNSNNKFLFKRTEANQQIDVIYSLSLNHQSMPCLSDHLIKGQRVVAAATYLALLINLFKQVEKRSIYAFEQIEFIKPLIIPDDIDVAIQIRVQPAKAGFKFEFMSGESVVHLRGQLVNVPTQQSHEALDESQFDKSNSISPHMIYQKAHDVDLVFQNEFCWLTTVYIDQQRILANLRQAQQQESGFEIHPGQIDSCFQSLIALSLQEEAITLYMPFSIARFYYMPHDAPQTIYTQLQKNGHDNTRIEANCYLYDNHQQLVLQIDDLMLRPAIAAKQNLLAVPTFQQIDLITAIKEIAPEDRLTLIVSYLQQIVGEFLKIDPDMIDAEQGFMTIGLDSLTVLEMKKILEASLNQTTLPNTIIFDYPNILSLAEYLLSFIQEIVDSSVSIANVENSADSDVREKLRALLGESN